MDKDKFDEEFGGLYSGEYSVDCKAGSGDPTYGIKAVICTYNKDEFEDELRLLLKKYAI